MTSRPSSRAPLSTTAHEAPARAWALVLLVIVLLAWEAAARWQDWSALVLPAPSVVGGALWRGLASGYFWPHLWQTTLEVLLGLAVGGTLGFALGLLLAESAFLHRLAMPYVVASQVVPKLALAPLMTVWLGFGTAPMVAITALVCFFPLLENTLTGIGQTDPDRRELFRMLGATRWQTLWRLKVRSGLPAILAGLRMAVVLALVGAVVGEFIGASRGLGALIIAAQGSMDTPLMFAVLVLITVLGLVLYGATTALQRWLLRSYTRSLPGDPAP
ncbi:ABC transporter permease [Achromobacter sp. GG226]|uniref:ABC transporter permease n=1 Tax=Verticiella alkaliphila TaxID=2779529 RepID=UPI001C0CADCA|nr:ABC transporter permease [Verticiella sp. GG226]MBU4612052.1 ABC transporter permease [Verticiella sp. GG226]